MTDADFRKRRLVAAHALSDQQELIRLYEQSGGQGRDLAQFRRHLLDQIRRHGQRARDVLTAQGEPIE